MHSLKSVSWHQPLISFPLTQFLHYKLAAYGSQHLGFVCEQSLVILCLLYSLQTGMPRESQWLSCKLEENPEWNTVKCFLRRRSQSRRKRRYFSSDNLRAGKNRERSQAPPTTDPRRTEVKLTPVLALFGTKKRSCSRAPILNRREQTNSTAPTTKHNLYEVQAYFHTIGSNWNGHEEQCEQDTRLKFCLWYKISALTRPSYVHRSSDSFHLSSCSRLEHWENCFAEHCVCDLTPKKCFSGKCSSCEAKLRQYSIIHECKSCYFVEIKVHSKLKGIFIPELTSVSVGSSSYGRPWWCQ